LQVFETHCFSDVDRALLRLGLDADARAEVKQRLRHALFVDDRAAARITRFAGRGDLRGWVRVMAVREGLALLRRFRPQTTTDDDAVTRLVMIADDPEVAYMKRRYRNEFRLAFAAALRGLRASERLLLRQRFLDGLAVNELARVHRVHRATVANRLDAACRRVLKATRASLVDRLRISAHEVDSILRLISSRLEVSLRLLQ
jgi:RNA polymerase sigma-70 factor (ECF subfamily)